MRSAIAWMNENHVAANLLMIFIVVGGAISLFNVKQEVFPELPLDFITIEVIYRGASPKDVEETVCVKIEEAVSGIEGVEKVSSVSSEGVGVVTAQTEFGVDIKEVRDRIKAEVDRITTLPKDAEKPVIKEGIVRAQVIQLGIFGDVDERTLKIVGEEVKNDLLKFPGITQVDISGVKNYEISIEVSEDKLRKLGMTFSEITTAVKAGSLDLPGGKIKTGSGEILLRTNELGKDADSYRNLVLRGSFDGSTLTVGDVAEVKDSFEDSDLLTFFNSKPAALIKVFRVGDQKATEVADIVKNYIKEKDDSLPAGLSIQPWADKTVVLRDRIDLLVRNAIMGFILVLITLALFLDVRLAMWVSSGIVISFLGAFSIMIYTDTSINVISLFAFILVLGIVVDDAIVVGENIFSEREGGLSPHEASKKGVLRVSVPVVFAVLTTIAAFSPLLFLEGSIGRVMSVIPVVVIAVLVLSLVESLFILPAHLGSVKNTNMGTCSTYLCKISKFTSKGLENFVKNRFSPFLKLAMKYKYTTIAINIFMLLFAAGLLTSGMLSFTFFPEVESDSMISLIEMPPGTSIDQTRAVLEKVEKAAAEVIGEYKKKYPEIADKLVENTFSIIGEQPAKQGGPSGKASLFADPSKAQITIELLSSEERGFSTTEMVNRWRELTGPVPSVRSLTFQANLFSSGNPIEVELAGEREEDLAAAVEMTEDILREYKGVFDIKNTLQEGKEELKLKLKPSASTLGLTTNDLAFQVRQAFFGDEALRIQRGQDEIRVMIRYKEDQRRSLADVRNMMIRTKGGDEIPFSDVAQVEMGRGYASINRSNRTRIASVTADVDDLVANSNEINRDLAKRLEKDVLPRFQNVSYSFEGSQREQAKSLNSLVIGYAIALLLIYILLAIPFKSYFQPLIIMSAIPFGLIGAIFGHVLLGRDMTILSLIGVVALSGVVVNDSLVLVDFINELVKEKGETVRDAVILAAKQRIRPILLTSVTTFAGLLPIIFETSLQAQFLIPMAISLGFGVVFSTVTTLVLVPAGILMVEDVKDLIKGKKQEVAQ